MEKKVTAFQQRVYDATSLIPKGKVTTYKHLAEYLHCNSSQAIGQALKRNPFAPEVPCHRVIKTDLSLGGYAGEYSDKKEILLQEEGINISDGKLVDLSQIFIYEK